MVHGKDHAKTGQDLTAQDHKVVVFRTESLHEWNKRQAFRIMRKYREEKRLARICRTFHQ